MRLICLLAGVSLLLGASPVLAEGDADVPRLRIATFDLGKVERASQRRLEGMKEIEARFAKRKEAFDLEQAKLRNMLQDLRGSVFRPGSPQHREMTLRAQDLERKIKRDGTRLTKDISAAKTELLHTLYADLEAAVKALVEAEGYHLVFQVQKPNKNLTALEMARHLNTMSLFHANPKFDVTEKLIAAMNEAYEKGK